MPLMPVSNPDFWAGLRAEWLRELEQNPNYNRDGFVGRDALEDQTRQLLQQITNTLGTQPIPALATRELEPVFSLWHHIMTAQTQKGVPLRDTAMLIFSLKTSVMNWAQARFAGEEVPSDLRQLNTILDLLGVLTFEVYTTEQERLIQRQSRHITDLQHAQMDSKLGLIIGSSQAMAAVVQAVELVLDNDVTVLLTGETGTGKDVIATLIHSKSRRKDKPFVVVNCGAIPKELIESELFGHEKGAFTSAERAHIGKFELANEGTLFLDEIGDLPLDLQVKLLRVLQNREVERLGGTTKIPVDVRIIAATNRDLKADVDSGKFRSDLYYRLHVFPIHLPPLRDRQSDIVPLALHFLNQYSTQFSLPFAGLSDDARHYLMGYAWPGNVRELENMMQRSIILAQGQVITETILATKPGEWISRPPLLSLPDQPGIAAAEAPLSLAEAEKQAIVRAIEMKNGNMVQAAKSLGISRATLYNKLKLHNIDRTTPSL
ncbi:AAA family ATPase [bacterium]|nr:AAA family ATPase [bacterium]